MLTQLPYPPTRVKPHQLGAFPAMPPHRSCCQSASAPPHLTSPLLYALCLTRSPPSYQFLFLTARSKKNGTYPQEQLESGKISKSRIKCRFYHNSSWFSVRGRSPAPLRSLKPYKKVYSMPSWTLFPVAAFETCRPPSPHKLVASRV
jgi:hypothetical protein